MRLIANRPDHKSLLGFTCLAALTLVALLLAALPASAATVPKRPLIQVIDSSETTAGSFSRPDAIAIDDATGAVYATDIDERAIFKFDVEGDLKDFSALGQPSLPLGSNPVDRVVVDNSDANPGRIYLASPHSVKALTPAGEFLPWELKFPFPADICDIAVDSEGHLWVSDTRGHTVKEFASTGSPPIQIGEVQDFSGTEAPCEIALDKEDVLYIGQTGGESFEEHSVDKYVGGEFDSVLSPYETIGIVTDMTKPDGAIFVGHNNNFSEYAADGSLIWDYGDGNNGEVATFAIRDIAYNPVLDRVYLAKISTETEILVFGPKAVLGTAPDLTIAKTSSGSIETAHVSGTINPLGSENSYHFEYRSDNQPQWSTGATPTATEHIVPADNSTHAVSADLADLAPFTQYQVRLVATNDETGVKNVSKVDRFRTGQFAVLTIGDPTELTGHTAKITGTVDPKDTETTWRFQTSSHPECLAGRGFSDHPSHPVEANSGPASVEETLTGLVAAQNYCVRIVGANSPGTATSGIKQFTTATVAPVVEGRGAAPRTETGARLNAFINPENATTTYRFEYSDDGGESWVVRPDRSFPIGTTSSVLVSEELIELEPGNAYSFRVVAENAAGTVQGEAQTFTTVADLPQACANQDVRAAQHTTYLGACRGIELVNNPDKGNQTPYAQAPPGVGVSPMSADGDKVLWYVLGGAPGGPNGSQSSFLAERTPAGWHSRSAAPDAEQQAGGGDSTYYLNAVTPDFNSFVFAARLSTGADSPPPPTIVRISDGQQDMLKTTVVQPPNPRYEQTLDLSDDGDHVLFVDSTTKQLEDIGAARVGPPEVAGEVVSLMPDGDPSECGLDAFGGTGFGGAYQPGYHWIETTDASRVYFQVPADGDCSGHDGLYVRNTEAEETMLIDPGDNGGTKFLRATPDGHRAYFITSSNLDPSDAGAGRDVYRWDEDSGAEGEASCLTCVAEQDVKVTGDMLVSDDFSHVYFASKNQLYPGLGRQGIPNLYVLSGGQIRFVALVSENVLGNVLDKSAGPSLSSDGNVLLLRLDGGLGLTTDAIAAKCTEPEPGGAPAGVCKELYRYDDRDRSIECLSCDHAGVTTHSIGSPGPGGGSDFRLSADGATAAFATMEALQATDVNQDTDIYEWRDGGMHLVTDGVSDFQEGFSAPKVLAVDNDGSDILFGIVPPGGRLTGYEQDRVLNIYDARIGGGLEPPAPIAECDGDSCQGALQAPPAPDHAASSDFAGRGNAVVRPRPSCRKGKVRRKGRCVKRHKHAHKRASRANRGGAK